MMMNSLAIGNGGNKIPDSKSNGKSHTITKENISGSTTMKGIL